MRAGATSTLGPHVWTTPRYGLLASTTLYTPIDTCRPATGPNFLLLKKIHITLVARFSILPPEVAGYAITFTSPHAIVTAR